MLRSFSISASIFPLRFCSLASAQPSPRATPAGVPSITKRSAPRAGSRSRCPIAPQASLANEKLMVAKLADACRLMDTLYWQQSDLGGWAVYRVTQNATLARLFGIMGSRYDLLEENETFLGEAVMPPGHELYPYGLTRQQIERYAAAHPEIKAGALRSAHRCARHAGPSGGRALPRSLCRVASPHGGRPARRRAGSRRTRPSLIISSCAPMPCSPTTTMPATSRGSI